MATVNVLAKATSLPECRHMNYSNARCERFEASISGYNNYRQDLPFRLPLTNSERSKGILDLSYSV